MVKHNGKTKYFIGGEEKHYTPCYGYVIYKANGPLKVMNLKPWHKFSLLNKETNMLLEHLLSLSKL